MNVGKCDYCKQICEEYRVVRSITFLEPILWLHFCSNECSIRWEAELALASGVKKRRYLFPQGIHKKKYLKEFLPAAIAKDKQDGITR
jgi:hypothetical protein